MAAVKLSMEGRDAGRVEGAAAAGGDRLFLARSGMSDRSQTSLGRSACLLAAAEKLLQRIRCRSRSANWSRSPREVQLSAVTAVHEAAD